MNTTTRNVRKRLMACVASLAIGTLSAVSASAAFAADPVYGNVTDQQGSITIHKHEPVNPSPAATPDGKGSVTGAPLAGVVFVAKKLDLDLVNKPGDWAKLPKADALVNACGNDGTPALTSPALTGDLITFPATSDLGVATKGQLPVGAYLVCEKTTAPGKTTIDKAAPFVVTLPFPDAKASKGWLYDVHVYPKNTVVEQPVKSVVVDETKGIGSTSSLTYTISNKIPHIAADESFSYFNVIDPLLPQTTDATVTQVVAGTETLTPTTHYTATVVASANGQNKHMQVSLTKAGLKLLKDNHAGENLVVTMTSKLNALPEAGQAPNTAYLFVDTQRTPEPPNTPTNPPAPSDDPNTPPTGPGGDPGTPSNPVLTGWGKYSITKTADNQAATNLTGAKFEVYLAQTQDENCTGKTVTGDALSVNGGEELKSVNGVISIEGLFVGQETGNDLAAMKDSLAKKHKCYVLKEIEAPSGYLTPEGDKALTPIKVTVGESAVGKNAVSITNTQIVVPELPLTGASGKVLMTIIGLSMILLATGGILYSRTHATKRR